FVAGFTELILDAALVEAVLRNVAVIIDVVHRNQELCGTVTRFGRDKDRQPKASRILDRRFLELLIECDFKVFVCKQMEKLVDLVAIPWLPIDLCDMGQFWMQTPK